MKFNNELFVIVQPGPGEEGCFHASVTFTFGLSLRRRRFIMFTLRGDKIRHTKRMLQYFVKIR